MKNSTRFGVFPALILVFTLASFAVLPSISHAVTVQASSNTLDNGSTLGNGLVGFWTMDGKDTNFTTAKETDESGNGNTGTLISLPSSSAAPGKIGQSLKFNGTSSYINVPSPSNANLNALTISAWVYLTSIPTNITILAGGTGSYQLSISSSKAALFKSTVGGVVAGNIALSTNKWYHVVVTYTGSVGKIYINGQLDNTATNPTTFNSPTAITIGQFASQQFVPGNLDDVRLYNRALSATEVQQLYNLGLGETVQASGTKLNDGSTLGNSSANGLIGYWPFDGKDTNWSTLTTKDDSGAGNTLALMNLTNSFSAIIGKMAEAFKFNGTTQYLTHSNISAFNFGTGDFSVSFWMNPNSPWGTANTEGLIGQKVNDSTNGWQIYQDSGHPGYLDMRLTQNNNFLTSTTIPTGKWTYVTFVRKSGTIYWYVNAAQNAVSTNSASVSDGSSPFNVGYATTWGAYYSGAFDDLRVYNRALSTTEISSIYNEGLGQTTQTSGAKLSDGSTLGAANGLITYWTMDGKDTNLTTHVETDESASGDTGTLTNLTAASATIGKLGQALSFNGTNQYIVGSQTINIPQVTESIWVKYSAKPSGSVVIAGFRNGTAYDKDLFLNSTGTVSWYTYSGTGVFTTSPSAITDGKWHHLVAVANGTNAILYIDGTQVATNAIGATYTSYGGPDIYVNGTFGGDGYSAGAEDDFRVYNRALSASEIQSLYQQGK